jgi:hypothetical protein
MFNENTSVGAYQNGYQPVSSTEIHRIKQLKHTTQVSIQLVFNHTSRSTIYNTIEISKKILIPVMKIHKLGILLLQALDNLSIKKKLQIKDLKLTCTRNKIVK